MNRRRPRYPISAALLGGLLSTIPLQAQSEATDTVPRYRLEGVTVTTTRAAVDRRRVPQKIDVVSASDLDRAPATNVAEALRHALPIDVIEYPGLLTGISIRGFRPQFSGINPRTLILLNGRPAGSNNLALLQLSGVERIEVLRGPASSLYGSSAMAGVVNVVTRRSEDAIEGRASAGVGTFGGYETRASAGGRLAPRLDFDVALSAVGRRSGYEPGSNRTFSVDSLLKTLPDGSTTRLPWTTADSVLSFSEYQAYSGSARVGYALGERWRVDASAESYQGNDVQNPGDLNVADWDSRSLKDVARGSVELKLTGSLESSAPSVRVYSAGERVDYFSAPEAPNFINFRTPVVTRGVQAQNVFRFRGHEVTTGFDYTSAESASEAYDADGSRGAPYSPDSAIRSAAAFGQLRLSLLNDRLFATGGGRLDRVSFEVLDTPNLGGYLPNTERHLVFTPSAGLRYSVTAGVQLYGNAGRAFVTPDAFNVAGYSEQRSGSDRSSVFVTRGNPELRPETSGSWDAGLSVRGRAAWEVDLGYFSTDVRDRISSETLPATTVQLTSSGDTVLSTTTYLNVDEAEIRGIEAQASYDFLADRSSGRSLRLFANGTRLLRAEERFVVDDRAQRIRNAADLTVIAGLDYASRDRFTGRLTARYVGERTDSDYVAWWAPGEILYPEYLVVDLTGTARIGDRYRVGVELRNLGDEDYFEVRGYNLPGRSVGLKAEVEF